MKTILYMAVSVNGHITQGENDSDWVSQTDLKEFDSLARASKVIVMGANTFHYFGDSFPVKGALNIVMTHDKKLLSNHSNETQHFTDKSPKEVLSFTKEKGFNQVMLIGGMTLNSSFIDENLVDELWLSVHPLFIGEGKTLVQSKDFMKNLLFIGLKELDNGLVQLRYSFH